MMTPLMQASVHSASAQAEWGGTAEDALVVFQRVGPTMLVVMLVLVALRTWGMRRRYSVDSVLGEGAQTLVHAALVDAERRTVGEIVPVVVERSDRHPGAEWLSGLVVLLAGTTLLEGVLPWHAPWLVILAQLGLGAIGFLLARWLRGWKRIFVSEARADEVSGEQALLEFQLLELHRTEARTGVLVFVSLLERRVIVLGDAGIHAKVGEAQWQCVRDAVLAGVKRGSLAEGLVEGVRACGAVLAEHFPATDGGRNEVPDRLVVRRQ